MLRSEQPHLAHSPITSNGRPNDQHSPVIPAEKLRLLYALMVRLREYKRMQSTANGRSRVPSFGEACEVAAVMDLHSGDTVVTLPGQSVGFVARSGSSTNSNDHNAVADTWTVLENGGRDRLAISAGVAFARQMQRTGNVVIAFAAFGEIARATDSVRFAQQQNLPIVYLERSDAITRKSKPTAHQLPAIPVDDADAVAVYRVAYEAIDKARRGAGPTLIQCTRDHNRSRSRLRNQRSDPVSYMEHYLRKQHLWKNDLIAYARASPPSTARI